MNPPANENEQTLSARDETPSSLPQRFSKYLTESFQLYRQWWKEISLGIFIRVLTLLVILAIASVNPTFPDINDMNELLTQGLNYMFMGLNPYNRLYTNT